MSITLECVLILFLFVLAVILAVLAVHAVHLIDETAQTMKSIREITDLTKQEIKPALNTVNNLLKTVDNVSIATNRQFDTVRKILTTLLGASCIALSHVKSKGGFFGGLINGFNFFRKRR